MESMNKVKPTPRNEGILNDSEVNPLRTPDGMSQASPRKADQISRMSAIKDGSRRLVDAWQDEGLDMLMKSPAELREIYYNKTSSDHTKVDGKVKIRMERFKNELDKTQSQIKELYTVGNNHRPPTEDNNASKLLKQAASFMKTTEVKRMKVLTQDKERISLYDELKLDSLPIIDKNESDFKKDPFDQSIEGYFKIEDVLAYCWYTMSLAVRHIDSVLNKHLSDWIYIYSIEQKKLKFKSQLRFDSQNGTPLKVSFSEEGSRLAVVSTAEISIFDANEGEFNNERKSTHRIPASQGQWRLIWGFFDIGITDPSLQKFNCSEPKYYSFSIQLENAAAKVFRIELPLHRDEYVTRALAGNDKSLTETQDGKLISVGNASFVCDSFKLGNISDLKLFRYNYKSNIAWYMSWEGSHIVMYSWTVKLVQDENDVASILVTNPTMNKSHTKYHVNKYQMLAIEDSGVAVASSPLSTIDLFTFNRKCEVKSIIHLPEKIKKISYMQSQDDFKFILTVVNEGIIYIWAKLNNDEYGVFFHNAERYPSAHYWLAPWANFIMRVEEKNCHIHSLILTQKNVYSFCRFPKSELTRDDSKVIYSLAISSSLILNFGSDYVSLFDIHSNRVMENPSEPIEENTDRMNSYFTVKKVLSCKCWEDESELLSEFEQQKFRGMKRAYTVVAYFEDQRSKVHARVYFIFKDASKNFDLYLRHTVLCSKGKPEKYSIFNGHLISWYQDQVVIKQVSSDNDKLPMPTRIQLESKPLRQDQNQHRHLLVLKDHCFLVRWITSRMNIPDTNDLENQDDISSRILNNAQISLNASQSAQGATPIPSSLNLNPPPPNLPQTSGLAPAPPPSLAGGQMIIDFNKCAVYGDYIDRPEDDLITIDDIDEINDLDLDQNVIHNKDIKVKSGTLKVKVQVFLLQLPQKGEKEYRFQSLNQLVINNNLEFLKVSKNGNYWIFFGQGGYDFYQLNTKNLDSESIVKAPKIQNQKAIQSLCEFKLIRRRHQSEYLLPKSTFVEFSPDDKYIAFYFTELSKLILYDARSLVHHSFGAVDKRVILKSKANFDDFPFIFKFYVPFAAHSIIDTSTLLAVCDHNSKTDKREVKLYNVDHDYFIAVASFSKQLNVSIVNIVDNPLTRKDGLEIILCHVQDNKKLEGVYTIQKNVDKESSDCQMPYAPILRKSIQNYFECDQDTSMSSQASPADILDNIFKLISHKYFFADDRLAYMMYMLNRPGLLEQVYRAPIDTGFFFSQHRALELLFSNQDDHKQHSSASVVNMMDAYIESRRFPVIREDYMLAFMRQRFDPNMFIPARRSMMTHILFAPCHVMITGLVMNRYNAIAPIRKGDSKKEELDADLVQINIKDIMHTKPKQVNDYVMFRSRIKLDLTNGSDFSINLIYAMLLMPDDEIRFKYRQLINYKWGLVFWYSFIYVILFQVLNVFAYIYFAYYTKTPFGITIIILNTLFITFDFICLSSSLKLSVRDPMNWLDVIIHGFSIFTAMILLLDAIESIHGYFKLVALIVVSLRGIMHLKMFGPLRIMVMMIGKILVDLAWVPFILVGVLILTASIYKVTPLPGGNSSENLNFIECLRTVFMIMFFNAGAANDTQVVDTSNTSSMLRSIIIVLGGTFIAQGILNFVIAVFIQTFKKVQDAQDVYELRSLLLDIKDFDLFLKPFNRYFKSRNEYYLIPVPIPKDGIVYENETFFDKAQSTWNTLVSEAAKKGLDKIKEQAKNVIKGKDREINMLTENIKSQSKANDSTAKALLSAANSLKDGGTIRASDLEQITDTIIEQAGSDGSPVLQNAKKAVDIIKSNAKVYNRAMTNDISMQNVLDILELACILTENACPHLKKGVSKVKQIKDILPIFLDLANKPKAAAENISKVMDVINILSNTFLDDSNEIKQRLPIITGTVRVVINEISKESSEDMDIPKMLIEVSKAISECVPKEHKNTYSKLESFSNNAIKVTRAVSTIVTQVGKLQDKSNIEPEDILQIGSDICHQVIPNNKKIASVIDLSKAITKSIRVVDKASSSGNLSTELILSSSETVKATNALMHLTKYISEDTMKRINTNVDLFTEVATKLHQSVMTGERETIRLVTMIEAAVPLYKVIMPNNTEVERRIKSIQSIVALLEAEINKGISSKIVKDKISRVDYGSLLESAGNILKNVFKVENIDEHLKKAGLAIDVIQASMEQADKNSNQEKAEGIVMLVKNVLEILTSFKPEWLIYSQKVNKATGILAKHAVKSIEDPSLISMADLSDDLFVLIESSAPSDKMLLISKLRRVVKAVEKHIDTFSEADENRQVSEYSEAIGEVVVAVYPQSEKYIKCVQQVMINGEQFNYASFNQELYLDLVCSTAEMIRRLANQKDDGAISRLVSSSLAMITDISKMAKETIAEQDNTAAVLTGIKRLMQSVFSILEKFGTTENIKFAMSTTENIMVLVEEVSLASSSKSVESVPKIISSSVKLVCGLLPENSDTNKILINSEKIVIQVYKEVGKGSPNSVQGLITLVLNLNDYIGIDPLPEFNQVLRLLEVVNEVIKAGDSRDKNISMVVGYLADQFSSTFPESADVARKIEKLCVIFQGIVEKELRRKEDNEQTKDLISVESLTAKELEEIFSALAIVISEISPDLVDLIGKTKIYLLSLIQLGRSMTGKTHDVKQFMQFAGSIITSFKPELSQLVDLTNANLELITQMLSKNEADILSLTTVVETAGKIIVAIEPDLQKDVKKVRHCMIRFQEAIRIAKKKRAVDDSNSEFTSYFVVAASIVSEYSPSHGKHLEFLAQLVYSMETMPMPGSDESTNIKAYIPAAKSLCQVLKRFYPQKSKTIEQMIILMETGFTALGAGIPSGGQVKLGVVIGIIEKFIRKFSGKSDIIPLGITEEKFTDVLGSWSTVHNIIESKSGSAASLLRIIYKIINNETQKKLLLQAIKLLEMFDSSEKIDNLELLYTIIKLTLPEEQHESARLQAIGSSISLIHKLGSNAGQFTPLSLISLKSDVGKLLIALRPQDTPKVKGLISLLDKLTDCLTQPASIEGHTADILKACYRALQLMSEAFDHNIGAAKPALVLLTHAIGRVNEISMILKKFENGQAILVSDLDICFRFLFEKSAIKEESKLAKNIKSMFLTLILIMSNQADFKTDEGQNIDLFQKFTIEKTSDGKAQFVFREPITIEKNLNVTSNLNEETKIIMPN